MSRAIDRSNLDTSVSPREDFYHFANGGWLKKHPIPDEFSRYGSFDLLRDENRKIVNSIIEEVGNSEDSADHIASLVGTLYRSGMDMEGRNKLGFTPIAPLLGKVEQLKASNEISDLLNHMFSMSFPGLFHIYSSPDRENAELVIAHFYQGGMGLPDVDYYRNDDERSQEIRKEYIKYINSMFVLAGESSKEEPGQQILEFESRLARAAMTRLEMRDPHLTFNKSSLEGLVKEAPGIDWKTLFNSLELDAAVPINIGQPGFFKEISTMVRELDIAQWKLFFKWKIINASAAFLGENAEQRKFEFYGAFLSDKKSMQPLWKRVTAATEEALGEAIGKLFVRKYFPPEAKERMLDLVENLRIVLGEKIDYLEWMSEETKVEAREKLARMRVKIGYPDRWRSFEDLDFKGNSYLDLIVEAGIFNMRFELAKIGKPVDKDEWHMTPQTVNAYYHPLLNEIVFPAGILQPPFFFKDADDAVNYGAIGVVIGHEMTHGFDDQGRKFDKNGNLNDWWTEADSKAFNERAKVIEDQFNNIQITEDVYADGKLSLGENIADLGGINISFEALKKAWEKQDAGKDIDGFNPVQRFFLSYAHIWANNIRKKEMIRMTKEDVHSLGINRVNGPLPNVEAFHKAFEVKPGDQMYLEEDKRASVW